MYGTDSLRNPGTRGFTLPAVLVVVAALLILAVGLLSVATLERSTSRSYLDRERAALAAKTGLEEVRGILQTEAANDDYIVFQSTLAAPTTYSDAGAVDTPYTFLARGNSTGFRLVPLFSNNGTSLVANTDLTIPLASEFLSKSSGTSLDDGKVAKVRTIPWTNDEARLEWKYIRDDKNRIVSRYAYMVEDLQGRVDAQTAGNLVGAASGHERVAWPFPAAGIKDPAKSPATEDKLNQIALYAVNPGAKEAAQGVLAKNLIDRREFLISPGSLHGAADIAGTTKRNNFKRLDDPLARSIEESVVPFRGGSYEEVPLIPWGRGYNSTYSGTPKTNLNDLLAMSSRPAAVDAFALMIRNVLPTFDQRKGGFPATQDYLKTLAAGSLDYADVDGDATLLTDARGLDSYPVVSEFIRRYSWDDAKTESGVKYFYLGATTWVELWNMTDKPVSGKVRLSYEAAFTARAGSEGEIEAGEMEIVATPFALQQIGGRSWFPEFTVNLKPNQHGVFPMGTVTYRFDVAPSTWAKYIEIIGETYKDSVAGYHLMWNGEVVDRSMGGIHRNDSNPQLRSNPDYRTSIPANGYKDRSNGGYQNSSGDPRLCYYVTSPQDASAYPENYSPIRRATRYKEFNKTGYRLYGQTLPSQWQDGGHDSDNGNASYYTTNDNYPPDAPRFVANQPGVLYDPVAEEAPQRISNQGRFFSATELGRIFDPVMWAMPLSNGAPGHAPSDFVSRWLDIDRSSSFSPSNFCGGGNTLRIGRPEHDRFTATPGQEAWRLLDLFHSGRPESTEGTEKTELVRGKININTAPRDAIKALVYGKLRMDPALSQITSTTTTNKDEMRLPVKHHEIPEADQIAEVDRITTAILEYRKKRAFFSPAQLSAVKTGINPVTGEPTGDFVIGNEKLLPDWQKIHRSDSAAEELFGRLYEATTVRSRNFRVWVVAQAIAPTAAGAAAPPNPEVLGEVRKSYVVFSDPGARRADSTIEPTNMKMKVLYEKDF